MEPVPLSTAAHSLQVSENTNPAPTAKRPRQRRPPNQVELAPARCRNQASVGTESEKLQYATSSEPANIPTSSLPLSAPGASSISSATAIDSRICSRILF